MRKMVKRNRKFYNPILQDRNMAIIIERMYRRKALLEDKNRSTIIKT